MKGQKLIQYLYIGLVILVLGFFGYVFMNENSIKISTRQNQDYFKVENVHERIIQDDMAPIGIKKEYTWNLQKGSSEGECLGFYVVHQYVDVYIENERVYHLGSKDDSLGKTVGSDWVFVPLNEMDQGKRIRVVITPVYKSVENREVSFLIGAQMEIYSDQLNKDFPELLLSMVLIQLGILLLFISLYQMFRKKSVNDFLYLSCFSLTLGVWKLSDTRFSPLLFPQHTYLLSCLSLVTLMISAIPLMMIIKNQTNKKQSFLLSGLTLLMILASFVMILLQLFHIQDFRETLFITHILLIMSILFITGILMQLWFQKSYTHKEKVKKGLFLFCIVGGMLDIIHFYVQGNSMGIFYTLVGFVLYIIMTGGIKVIEISEQEKRLKEQEAELARSRVSIMLSQIQPHFLYNALNSIYHLCEMDPMTAKKAIIDFSDYLRVNLDSLNRTTLVPFSMELKHIKTYLNLEKMRFEEDLQVVYDIQTVQFSLPSLTIQPLVENAIKHGMKGISSVLTLTIQTIEKEETYEIHVIDDGKGFDISQKNTDTTKTHVGIENVRNRLSEMCHGSLQIQSEIGKGTHAVVVIPKSKNMS